MASVMEVKPIAWSFSSLEMFKNCGRRYYEERVAKSVKSKPSEAMSWGNRVHKAIELHLKAGQELTPEMGHLHEVVNRLAKTKGELQTEQQLAITKSFKPTGWFAPDVWCRAIIDAGWIDGEKARLVDWKSGKRKKDSTQLRLSALLCFAHHPEVEKVNTAFVWLQTGAMDVEKYKREDIPVLWQDFLPDIRRLEYAHKTTTFVPKPSGLCNYCPVTKCTFWRGTDGEGGQKR